MVSGVKIVDSTSRYQAPGPPRNPTTVPGASCPKPTILPSGKHSINEARTCLSGRFHQTPVFNITLRISMPHYGMIRHDCQVRICRNARFSVLFTSLYKNSVFTPPNRIYTYYTSTFRFLPLFYTYPKKFICVRLST